MKVKRHILSELKSPKIKDSINIVNWTEVQELFEAF